MKFGLHSFGSHPFFEKPGDGGSGGGGNQQPPPAGNGNNQGGEDTPPADWDSFISGQSEDVQSLYNGHTSGLRSALKDERSSVKNFKQQVDDLSAQLEKGSDAQKQLDLLSAQLETQGRQSEFYEDAQAAGVTNFKLAWLAFSAEADDLSTRNRPDFEKIKERHPELFRKPQQQVPPGNPGSGTGSPPSGGKDINKLIREASGRVS